jgi:hypothetical protein
VAKVQLLDYPEKLMGSDEECATGEAVRFLTWSSAAHLINYLNFYARRVLPFNSWDPTYASTAGMDKVSFIYPLDEPTYSGSYKRWLTCCIQIAQIQNADHAVADVTLTVDSETGASISKVVYANLTNVGFDVDDDDDVFYMFFDMEVDGSMIERITASITNGTYVAIMGFAAWELPPAVGGEKVAVQSGAIWEKHANIDDSISGVLDPDEFLPAEHIDTDVSDIVTGQLNAWTDNRRIICSVGAADPDSTSIHTFAATTATTGAWTSVIEGGLYVPAYAQQDGTTYHIIRAGIFMQNQDASSSAWRIKSSSYTSSEDNVANQVAQWRPMSISNGDFDTGGAGLALTVPTAGEWITIEVYQSVASNLEIYQVILWEAG